MAERVQRASGDDAPDGDGWTSDAFRSGTQVQASCDITSAMDRNTWQPLAETVVFALRDITWTMTTAITQTPCRSSSFTNTRRLLNCSPVPLLNCGSRCIWPIRSKSSSMSGQTSKPEFRKWQPRFFTCTGIAAEAWRWLLVRWTTQRLREPVGSPASPDLGQQTISMVGRGWSVTHLAPDGFGVDTGGQLNHNVARDQLHLQIGVIKQGCCTK